MAIKLDAKKRHMILTGDLMKTVLAICLPLALYQFFNSLYTVLDQFIAADISSSAQKSIVVLSQIKNSFSAIGGGLAAGGCVLVSRYYGAGNVKNARYTASNLFFLSIIVSLILMLVLIPLAEPIMILCQAKDLIKTSGTYFKLQFFELVFVSVNSVFIGIQKAKGSSRSIMLLNIMVLCIKLGLSCFFVYGTNGKCASVIYMEVATIIGQATLTCIGLFILFNKNNILKLSAKMFLPRKEFVAPIIKLSFPIFLGKFVMSLGKVVVNSMCGYYWDAVTEASITTALGVSNNMCGLVTSPTNSFEEGESAIVSQNLGNKNIKRALRTFSKTLISVAVISTIGFVLLRFFLCDWFAYNFSSPEDKVNGVFQQYVKEIFVWDSLSIPALGLTAAVLGLLYGFGQTKLSSILNFCRIGSRIVILFLLHTFFPNLEPTFCAGLSMGISNIVIMVIATLFLIAFFIKVKKKGYNGMQITDPEPEVSELVIE